MEKYVISLTYKLYLLYLSFTATNYYERNK